MNAKEHTRKHRLLGRALVCGFVLAALCSFFPFAAACGQLPRDVVRLHVVANSNGAEDQAVKLLVRDAVLEEAARWYQGAGSMEEASSQLCTHLQSIAGAARQVLGEQGVDYSATAQMTEMYFPTRDYGDFRLPAGRYRTLRVTLGEGAGKNWWCVVFPSRHPGGGPAHFAGGGAPGGGGRPGRPGEAQGRGAVGIPAGVAARLMVLFQPTGMWYTRYHRKGVGTCCSLS